MLTRTARAKVLIVGDDRNARGALAVLLAEEGYETLEVPDYQQAVESIFGFSPDVMVTDMWRLGMAGLSLVAEVLRSVRCAHFIVMSSFAAFRQFAQAAGADDFLLKPINLDTLFLSIERAASRSFEERERGTQKAPPQSSA